MPQTFSEFFAMAVQYMSPAIAFAVVLAALLAAFALYYLNHVPAPARPMGEDGAPLPSPRFTFVSPRVPLTRQDRRLCLILTLTYAATAFFHLGSFRAPQSTLDFKQTGTVEFELSQVCYITSLRYFPSLGTGAYNVEISSDGSHWSTLWARKDDPDDPDKVTGYYWADAEGYSPSYALPQGYNDLFKWKTITFDNPQNVKYVRMTPRAERDTLQLAELAFYSDTGESRDPQGLLSISPASPENRDSEDILVTGADPLFDERDTVPAQSNWYNSAYFDEIYHPRTALEHIENFHPYETTHPPLGKLIIGLGIRLFGMTPFGWRFMGTLFGVLMLPILYVFLKNFFGKSLIAVCGVILFATDFMHLTQTRIATIDTYAVFFILGAYFFLYRWLSLPRQATVKQGALPLFLSGLLFGIGAASKWTVLYAGAGMAVLYLLNLIFRWRDWKEEGAPPYWPWAGKTILLSVLFFVVIPVCIYTASYYPYALDRGDTSLKAIIDVMLANQKHMFTYHQGVTTPHPYQSKWWMWLLDARPILYYMSDGAGTNTRFAAFLNPLLCWGGLLALFLVARRLWQKRDGKALFILIGYLSQLVPWIPISRPTFNYHYFPAVPFLVFALCYLFYDLSELRPSKWRRWVLGLTGGSAALYVAFYPVLVGLTIPTWYSTALRWFPSWPF